MQRALQVHLRSPFHAEPFLFCPEKLISGTAANGQVLRAFKSASALAQHLGSGTCAGGIEVSLEALGYLEKRLKTLNLSFTMTDTSHMSS